MSFHFSSFFLFLSALISMSPCFGMLISGHTVVSPDKKRYIALLGHCHEGGDADGEAQQLDDLVAICKQGVQMGKKFHILYERTGDTVHLLTPRLKTVLGDIEQTFAEAEVPDCIIENVEIRDAAAAAFHIFLEQGKVLDDGLTWNKNSKTFCELTFQDIFEEFERHAGGVELFVQSLMQENTDCPNACLIQFKSEWTRENINKIRQYLHENKLNEQTKILKLARERIADCRKLSQLIRAAFSDLFDLHILRRLMQLDPAEQPIVVAGAMHTTLVEQSLNELKWETPIHKGDIFADIQTPLDHTSLRSFVLNETQYTGPAQDIFKSIASAKVTILALFQSLRETICNRYCK